MTRLWIRVAQRNESTEIAEWSRGNLRSEGIHQSRSVLLSFYLLKYQGAFHEIYKSHSARWHSHSVVPADASIKCNCECARQVSAWRPRCHPTRDVNSYTGEINQASIASAGAGERTLVQVELMHGDFRYIERAARINQPLWGTRLASEPARETRLGATNRLAKSARAYMELQYGLYIY